MSFYHQVFVQHDVTHYWVCDFYNHRSVLLINCRLYFSFYSYYFHSFEDVYVLILLRNQLYDFAFDFWDVKISILNFHSWNHYRVCLYCCTLSWCQINRSLFDFVKLDMTSSKLNRVTWEFAFFARRLASLISHLYSRFNFALLFVVSFFVLYIHQTLSLL